MQIFHTGTLRGSAAAAKNLWIFRKNGSHVWGAGAQPPSAQSVTVTYSLNLEDI